MGEYKGADRRKCQTTDGVDEAAYLGYCSKHIDLTNDLTEIKASVKNIESSMVDNKNNGHSNSRVLMGLFVSIIIEIIVFAFLYGQIYNQVKVDSGRIENIERCIFKP